MTLKIIKVCLLNTRCLAALLTAAAMFTATPTLAQTFNIPTLQFPDAETGWGCLFHGTCPGSVVIQDGS
jgi:hypothetical protein